MNLTGMDKDELELRIDQVCDAINQLKARRPMLESEREAAIAEKRLVLRAMLDERSDRALRNQ